MSAVRASLNASSGWAWMSRRMATRSSMKDRSRRFIMALVSETERSVYASPACPCRQRSAMLALMHIVIISGLSGSGKSIALNMLEDAAYYCVDNLPSQLLQPLVEQLGQQGYDKVAVVIDIRGGDSLAVLPQQLAALRALGFEPQFLFLDTKTETLLKRY